MHFLYFAVDAIFIGTLMIRTSSQISTDFSISCFAAKIEHLMKQIKRVIVQL